MSVWGSDSSDDAKITGMTPPALTFSGRCVDCPPIIRRPTTRRAYWTGILRSPRSTKTMNPTTTIIATTITTATMTFHWPVTKTFSYTFWTAPGRPTTMPAKMIRDMPLPMPRSVICSPSHMMNAVPVVRVRIIISRKPHPGW